MVAGLVPAFGPNALAPEPPAVPWLATTLMPGIASQSHERIVMLGDFGRCVAWAIIEAAVEASR